MTHKGRNLIQILPSKDVSAPVVPLLRLFDGTAFSIVKTCRAMVAPELFSAPEESGIRGIYEAVRAQCRFVCHCRLSGDARRACCSSDRTADPGAHRKFGVVHLP